MRDSGIILKHKKMNNNKQENSQENKQEDYKKLIARTAELISVIQRKAGNKKKMIELIEMYKSLIDNLEKSRIIK